MSNIILQTNIGSLIDERVLSSSLSFTAGGASDGAQFVGLPIDRASFSPDNWAMVADIIVAYSATLGSGNVLSVSANAGTGPSATGPFGTFASWASAVVATGPSGGGRVTGVYRLNSSTQMNADAPPGTPGVSLKPAARYIKVNYTPTLSATGTDTAITWAIGVFAGWPALPAPQT